MRLRLGRDLTAHRPQDRSGLGAEKTKFTQPDHIARGDGKKGIGKAGGQPWTEKWLKFDNSYFTTIPDANAGAHRPRCFIHHQPAERTILLCPCPQPPPLSTFARGADPRQTLSC